MLINSIVNDDDSPCDKRHPLALNETRKSINNLASVEALKDSTLIYWDPIFAETLSNSYIIPKKSNGFSFCKENKRKCWLIH